MTNNKNNSQEWFSDHNISSIAGDVCDNEAKKIETLHILEKHKKDIIGFMSDTEMKPSNISHILNRSGDSGGDNIEDCLHILLQNKDKIYNILAETNFLPVNISSILGKSNKPETLTNNITKLTETIDKFNNFTNIGVFTSDNISSILSQGGNNLTKEIDTLLSKKDDLIEFAKNSKFSANNISTILHRSRGALEKNIDFILSKDFVKLTDNILNNTQFRTNDLATILSGANGVLKTKIADINRHSDKFDKICSDNNISYHELAKALATIETEKFARTILDLHDGKTKIESPTPSNFAGDVIRVAKTASNCAAIS